MFIYQKTQMFVNELFPRFSLYFNGIAQQGSWFPGMTLKARENAALFQNKGQYLISNSGVKLETDLFGSPKINHNVWRNEKMPNHRPKSSCVHESLGF